MTTLTEGMHSAEFIINEMGSGKSRSIGAVLASGQDLDAGAVVGQKLTDTATIAAQDGNTGDADISGVTVTLGAAAVPGVYLLTCTAETGNAGTFSVVTPDGTSLANLTVASAYTSTHINLTLPDGTTDWAVGDVVTVEVGSMEYTELDPDATNGSQIAAGILYAATDATSAAAACTVINWAADVNDAEITWPTGITDAEKAIAIQQLEARHIRLLTGE
jgi:hypothetical protein